MGADSEAGAQGPDLARGVDEGELGEGGTLLGHAAGEAVLLARRGDEVLAIGAKCTHYGGPLAEGLVVGDTVRCPWHHACFSLRTGAALAAPALDAVACWKVERHDGRIFVTGKVAQGEGRPGGNAPAQRAVAPGAERRAVVILGGGAAGHAAAEMLRREGHEGPITIVSRDQAPPCDRPNLSKDYLAGVAPEEWIPLRPRELYDRHGIALELGARTTGIDLGRRRVTLADGRSLPWDALLVATGADPIRLPIPGDDDGRVLLLRTLADSRAILSRLPGARRAVVIGASFIGLEVAASLRTRGLLVDVVAPEDRPLERVLGTAIGDRVRAIHEARGVRFHLGHTIRELEAGGVTLDDGSTLGADLVIAGVGVRPAVALAQEAGLAVDRGIVVDAELRTNAPDVWAAGDVARYPDPRSGQPIRIEHWVHAQRMGQCAARNILGRHEHFAAVPFFWSQHYDVTIAVVGHAEKWDRADVAGDPAANDCAVAFRHAGRTLALATIGRDRTSLQAEAAMERGDDRTLEELVPPSG